MNLNDVRGCADGIGESGADDDIGDFGADEPDAGNRDETDWETLI